MQDSNAHSENDRRLDVTDLHSVSRTPQELIWFRLPYFYRCALRVLGNAADAGDALQEVLLAASIHVNQFRGQSQMSTRLTTILRNCVLMQLRRWVREIHLPSEEIEEKQHHLVREKWRTDGPALKMSTETLN